MNFHIGHDGWGMVNLIFFLVLLPFVSGMFLCRDMYVLGIYLMVYGIAADVVLWVRDYFGF